MQHRLEPQLPAFPAASADAGPMAARVDRSRPRHEIARFAVLALVAFLLGVGTSIVQGLLPNALRPLANSPSGWTLCTAVLVALLTTRNGTAVLGGIIAFALLNFGYTTGSNLTGHPDSFTGFWVVIGFVVGGPLGLAAHWLSSTTWRTASGAAALAAVGLGDAGYGLMHPGSSTSLYDLLLIAITAALLGFSGRRLRAPLPTAVMTAAAVVLALAYIGTLSTLG